MKYHLTRTDKRATRLRLDSNHRVWVTGPTCLVGAHIVFGVQDGRSGPQRLGCLDEALRKRVSKELHTWRSRSFRRKATAVRLARALTDRAPAEVIRHVLADYWRKFRNLLVLTEQNPLSAFPLGPLHRQTLTKLLDDAS
jgi:hypothetical protein